MASLTQILEKVAERYAVLGWGNSWYFYEPREEEGEKDEKPTIKSLDDLDTVKRIKKFEKDGTLEDDEEKKTKKPSKPKKVVKNPPAVEESHQKAVLKSRKVYDKCAALEKVQDVEFLKKIILSKAHEEVKRRAAGKLTKEEDAKELFLARPEGMENFPAKKLSDLLTDEKFIIKHFDKIKTQNALQKVSNENTLVDLALKYPEVSKPTWIHGNSYLLKKVTNQKLISKVGMAITKNSLSEHATLVALKSKDEKVLKHILSLGHSYATRDAANIALYKLRNTEAGKKAATEILKEHYGYGREEEYRLAIGISEDQQLLEKHLSKAPELVLPRLTDKSKIKDLAKDKPELWAYIKDDDWKKEQRKRIARGSDAGHLMQHTLDHIEDQKYVKEEALKGGILSKAWLTKLKKDQDFIKQYYEKTKEYPALSVIEDVTYLEGLLKKEKKSDPREKIIKNIDDPDILLKLLKKERNKGTRHVLIWKLRKHPEKIADYLVNDFDDQDTHDYGSKKLDKKTAIKLLDREIGGEYKHKIEKNALIDKIADDQKLLLKYYNDPNVSAYHKYILPHIKDEDFLLQKTDPTDIDSSMLENIKKPENLYNIALKSNNAALQAFHKLKSLTAEQYAELARQGKSTEVRKAAIPYVQDKKVLQWILLNDPELGADALPAFKDDIKTLEQAFLKAKDRSVVSNLASRIKNQDILKRYVLDVGDNWQEQKIAEKILPRIQDPELVKNIAKNAKSEKMTSKAYEVLIKDPANHRFLIDSFLERTDDSIRPIYRVVKDHLKRSDYDRMIENPAFLNKFFNLIHEPELAVSAESAARALKKSGYNDSCLEFLIEHAGKIAYPEIRKIAESTKNFSLLETCLKKLAEDPDNGTFLSDLYTRRDWSKFGYDMDFDKVTSIVGPFLNSETRMEMFRNPSIVNELSLEDFKPSEEEAAVALSNPRELRQNHLFQLLKIAPSKAPEVFDKVKDDMRGSVLPFITPDFVTEDRATLIANAITNSHHQNAIPQALIDKTYTLGDERVKEHIKHLVTEQKLTDEHKTEQQHKRFKYRVPQHSRNIPNEIKNAKVQHHAKEELFRLLVQLAR